MLKLIKALFVRPKPPVADPVDYKREDFERLLVLMDLIKGPINNDADFVNSACIILNLSEAQVNQAFNSIASKGYLKYAPNPSLPSLN